MTEVAGTPSSYPGVDSAHALVASADTLAQLEFPAALAEVAARAVSSLGADRVRARRPRADATWVRDELAAVAELAAALEGDEPFRPEPIADLSDVFALVAVPGSVLDGEQLVALGRGLAAMRVVARALTRLAERAPRVARLRAEPPTPTLETAIDRALEPDGTVKDDASPALKRARIKVREARARLVSSLEALLARLEPGDRPADGGVTLREGRYVIPVRRGTPRVAGIVHDTSGSGATLFVEPQEAIELGNELRAAENDEARAVLAVLRDLTQAARETLPQMRAAWEMCIAVDDVYARARYQRDVVAELPTVTSAPGSLVIRGARHPLMIAAGVSVVPFDLLFADGTTCVVISGPNTGGKTVLLKTAGLVAALAQSGVVPPLAAGTRLPVLRRIFADIGDHQSIAASLSTFSAHVATVRVILAEATADSLVLIDEIGNGTDPAEGAALATAVLGALLERRTLTLATTHLAQLKDVAARTAGAENASLEFDAATLRPTYRFLQGLPGRSYGLAIARRLGVPADVLAAADAALPAAQRDLEALLTDMERRLQQLEARELDVAQRSARAGRTERELAERAAALEQDARAAAAREREAERAGREQARQLLLEARKRVEEALGAARAAVSEATAREARRLVEEGVRRESEALKKLDDVADAKGWRVVGGTGKKPKGAGATTLPKASTSRVPVRPAPPSEIDLRGLTADEASAALVSALDDAVVADLPALRVIHGKGTGALRAAVQGVLVRDTRVTAFRLAPANQGGTGVTIAELAP